MNAGVCMVISSIWALGILLAPNALSRIVCAALAVAWLLVYVLVWRHEMKRHAPADVKGRDW